MILRHFADTLVFATNSGTTCNEVRSVETPVKEPDEWNQAQNKTNKNLSNEVLFSYYETRKKSILVNIELYNVDEQIKNHFY